MKDACNLCLSDGFELVKSALRDQGAEQKVYRCLACGHVQLLPRPTAEEDSAFYDANRQDRNRGKEIDYERLRLNNLFDTERHVSLIKGLCADKGSRILDIGAGYGFFVNRLYGAGYTKAMGIEVSEERRAMAVNRGRAEIIDFDVLSPGCDIGRFAIVTLFHVLEHMADPVAFLRGIKGLLSDGAVFVCEVPNVNELLLERSKTYNDFYWIRAHLNYFSAKTLVDCFTKAGYAGVQMRFEQRYGLLNMCNWLSKGTPQIDHPVFEIDGAYKPVEDFYREHLASMRKTDTIVAVAGLKK
ncbi:MAG: class I SAM-dependent methyltransferase [Deltaproteobacteria bacterium]|nr:class I SAM-dependent methyltransferase [Deltaproteobacteria bacterium]